MRRVRSIWLGFVSASLALAASTVTSKPATAQEPPALGAIVDPAEKARVRNLIEGARKEGALSWIGVQFEPDRAGIILAEFKRHYGLDSLRTGYVYASTGEIINQIETFLSEKRNSVDIVWSSSWAWYKDLLRRGEIMRYESPHYRDYTLSDRNGMSEPGYWVSDAYSFSPLYNPAALARRGIRDLRPTSWADFVDPRLAGSTSMIDPLVSASAAPVLAGVTKVLGDDWLRKLGANKPALHVRGAQGRDAVGSGAVALTLLGTPADALSLIERGVAVKQAFPSEGVVLIPFTPIILKDAPHPNAARLFIDFVRSRHGAQSIATQAGALLFFGRPGIELKHPELMPAAEDVKVIPFDWNREGSDEAIGRFRDKARAAGIGRD